MLEDQSVYVSFAASHSSFYSSFLFSFGGMFSFFLSFSEKASGYSLACVENGLKHGLFEM